MASQSNKTADKTSRDLSEILDRVDRLPVLDDRSADEIVGYDENGFPRLRDASDFTWRSIRSKASLGKRVRPYSSSSFTSPRSALAFSIIFSCNCPGTTS
jgi:hypothetical protein